MTWMSLSPVRMTSSTGSRGTFPPKQGGSRRTSDGPMPCRARTPTETAPRGTALPGDHHKRHEHDGRNERDQQAKAVDPERKSKLNERKGEVDRVPTEAIRSRADDSCRGAIARHGSPGRPEATNSGEEECARHQCDNNADWRSKGMRHKGHRPQGMEHEAECDRPKVDERRTNETEVRDIGLGSLPTVAS